VRLQAAAGSLGNVTGAPEYDLLVIGSGPAGEKGAAQAAYFGKRVAIVEADEVGGAATNTGTLPSKVLRETALHVAELRQRDPYGLGRHLDKELTPEALFFRKQQVVETNRRVVLENIRRHGIDLFRGLASLKDAQTVLVRGADGTEKALRGRFVLVAAGSAPFRPAALPFDDEVVFDSDSILGMTRLPTSMLVVGGGVIGCEYASLFAALGIEVKLIDRGRRLLPFIDEEVASALQDRMRQMGVELMQGRYVRDVTVDAIRRVVHATLDDGTALEAESLLFCGGRQGRIEGLGLEALGIGTDERGRIKVNDHYQTAVPNIYAAGDVIGHPALAATSMEQARVGVCHAFGFDYKQAMSPLIPYGIYTIPTVSAAGLSEEQARDEGRRFVVGRASYATNPRGQIVGDTAGFLKLVIDAEDRKLIGVHMIGEGAFELVHIGQVAMQLGGTVDVFIDNVFNFPTLSDLYKYAAYDALGKLNA
jgi:NAD(P) transhydrogenase